MRLPYLKHNASKTLQQTVQFAGIRYGRGGVDGEFAETLNLSSKQFPALSQRGGRALAAEYKNATALFAKEKLLVVDGKKVIYDSKEVGTVTEGEKVIASVNTKILIFPDKKYYDVEEEKFGDMEASITATKSQVDWTESSLKMTGKGDLTEVFAAGQGVEISGSSIEGNNKTIVLQEVSEDTLTFLPYSFLEETEKNSVTVSRNIPDLTCICESANRLWGSDGKTIWASAQADPLSFYKYSGISTDSYTVEVGTDGSFTGCISYGSNVLFFKENTLHKVLGSEPSEYRVYDYTIPGVQAGSQKSMVVINELLFYKGTAGIYSYNGSSPSLISENFGIRRFKNADAGTDGTKYYISMQDEDSEEWSLFVFDPQTGIWLREDDTHVIDFARQDTVLHFLNAADGDVYTVEQDDSEEGRFPWSATFIPFDDAAYGKKGYSKLWIKMELEPGAWVKAEISEDAKPFRIVGIWSNEHTQSVIAPVFPERCDTFRLRLSGLGRCIVKNIVREFDIGSER